MSTGKPNGASSELPSSLTDDGSAFLSRDDLRLSGGKKSIFRRGFGRTRRLIVIVESRHNRSFFFCLIISINSLLNFLGSTPVFRLCLAVSMTSQMECTLANYQNLVVFSRTCENAELSLRLHAYLFVCVCVCVLV